jgi:hypothetical protein
MLKSCPIRTLSFTQFAMLAGLWISLYQSAEWLTL